MGTWSDIIFRVFVIAYMFNATCEADAMSEKTEQLRNEVEQLHAEMDARS